MIYKSYMHIERLGTEEVEGIELGTCYCFPKIDGTNASIWVDAEGNLQTGSRNRWLAEGQADNGGFRAALASDSQFDGIKACLKDNPKLRFYGEWLIPHSLKIYKEDAWRKFYVFDVTCPNDEGYEQLIPFEAYQLLCEKYGIKYIPCIKKLINGVYDDFVQTAQQNEYLIEAGKGVGEGIVIKNYQYRNKFGRQTWAKIVTAEFKEVHYNTMGAPEKVNNLVEDEIAKEYVTEALIDKTKAKIELLEGGWSSKAIPRLLNTVYHDLVSEEAYNFVKKHNLPTVNFKTLSHFVTARIKEVRPEYFGMAKPIKQDVTVELPTL